MEQFVSVPNTLVESSEISPKTLVVYCALKRYMNKDTLECFPSIKLVASKCGCSEKTVKTAIDELVKNEFITKIVRPGQSNVYKFSTHKGFEPFSYDFLDDTKIKLREKAYLIAQQKNMFKENGIGVTSLSTKEIANKIHMSVPTVLSCENNLIKAGYLTKPDSKIVESETGLHEKLRMYLLQLYNLAAITYRQTQKNTEDIEYLKNENKELKKQIEILTRKVFKEEPQTQITI